MRLASKKVIFLPSTVKNLKFSDSKMQWKEESGKLSLS